MKNHNNIKFLFLVSSVGVTYGFQEVTLADWQALRTDQMVKQPIVKQRSWAATNITQLLKNYIRGSWAATNITQPLKNYIRAIFKSKIGFKEEKIAEKEQKIVQDKAAYGHIKRISKYSPEYNEWQENVKENPTYATANPIVLEEEVLSCENKGFNQMGHSLIEKGKNIYNRKDALEKELKNTPFWKLAKKKKLKESLAIASLDLDSVDNAIDELPMLKAHMRMKAQDVRTNRLVQYKKI